MIYEMRTYRCLPGNAQKYLSTYEAMAYELQLKHQKNLVGFWQTDVGPLNRVVNIWAYEDMQARNEAKAALAQEPGWHEYLKTAQPLLLEQESCFLKPAAFMKLKV